MKPAGTPSYVRRCAASLLLASMALAVAGCSGGGPFKKTETIEEGHTAARREAEADVLARANAGEVGLEGTDSTVPALDPDDGRPLLPAPNAPPPTAPPEDKFENDNPDHLLARCRDRSARHQWFDAVGDCRRSHELRPSVEAQAELMRLLVSLQAYADAEASAKYVLAARPGDPVALYYLAWAYRSRDQHAKAIAALQRAIAADPKRVEYVQALGQTYCLAENYGKCILTLERAQAMRPGDTRLKQMIHEARERAVEKLAPYQKLVREQPDSYDNHAALGFIFQKHGFSQRALSSYDAALAKIPTPIPQQSSDTKKIAAQVYYNRGVVYRDLGKPDLAEPSLWQSMQLDPSLAAVAWYYIGLSRYDAGKYDSSIDALRKSIDLAPGVADNREALALAYDKAGKKDLAAEQRNAVAAIEARGREEKDEIAAQEARGGKTEEELAASPPAAPAAAEASGPPAAQATDPAAGALPPDAALQPAPATPPPAAVMEPVQSDPGAGE